MANVNVVLGRVVSVTEQIEKIQNIAYAKIEKGCDAIEETELVIVMVYNKVKNNLGKLSKMAFENAIKVLEGLAWFLKWDISDNIGRLRYLFGRDVSARRQVINQVISNTKNVARAGEKALMDAGIKELNQLAYQLGVSLNREIEDIERLFPGDGLRISIPLSQKQQTTVCC